jgi:hypothetical protein
MFAKSQEILAKFFKRKSLNYPLVKLTSTTTDVTNSNLHHSSDLIIISHKNTSNKERTSFQTESCVSKCEQTKNARKRSENEKFHKEKIIFEEEAMNIKNIPSFRDFDNEELNSCPSIRKLNFRTTSMGTTRYILEGVENKRIINSPFKDLLNKKQLEALEIVPNQNQNFSSNLSHPSNRTYSNFTELTPSFSVQGEYLTSLPDDNFNNNIRITVNPNQIHKLCLKNA